MMPGQLALKLFFQLGLALLVLALRTVSIAAGLEYRMDFTAALAFIDDQAPINGPAADYRIDDFSVACRHLPVAVQILRAK